MISFNHKFHIYQPHRSINTCSYIATFMLNFYRFGKKIAEAVKNERPLGLTSGRNEHRLIKSQLKSMQYRNFLQHITF